jgi:hypothetical protein
MYVDLCGELMLALGCASLHSGLCSGLLLASALLLHKLCYCMQADVIILFELLL